MPAGVSLLKERNFLLLFLATLISTFGSSMAPIALAFGVLDLTGSTSASAIVIAAPVVAQLVVLMVSGTLADRTSRRLLIVFACVWASLFQGLTAAAFIAEFATVPLLTGLALASGVVIAITFPATTGLIPLIVARDQLQDANSLLGIARNTSLVLGTALAGVLVAVVGPGIALALDAATFAVAGLMYFALRPARQIKPPPASFVEDIRKGWQAFVSHRWLWIMVVQFSFVAASLQSVNGLLGPAVTRTYMNGSVDWGLISAALGAG
ncbi:MAG: MFS transporter, partial [Gammaproteobacteria bacterium]|nr:MFS transporter [Gammaproteobacteria bacterium]